MRKAIITVNIGGYDSLNQPLFIDEDWDYLCFTDSPNHIEGAWEQIPVGLIISDGSIMGNNHLISRYVKTKVLEIGYELVVYMDGNMQQISSINDFVNRYHKETLTICQHPARNCIYDEAKECIRLGFSPEVKTNFQMLKYKELGYPENNGLIMGGFFVVTRDKWSKDLLWSWWKEIKSWECRDQFCFNKVLWEKNYNIEIVNDSEVFGKVVKTYPHILKRV